MKLPRRLRLWLLARVEAVMTSRPPDFIVGDDYLRRWHLLPRNSLFNVYAHLFLHDDDDRALHDHPYANVSFVLDGGYHEHMSGGRIFLRDVGIVVARRPTTPHRIMLRRTGEAALIPAVTLFITGPRVREWGFTCPQGWRRWQDFVHPTDRGKVGPGCS